MCKRLTVIILILGVLFVPAVAFADDGFEGSGGGDFSDQVIYGPNVLDILSGTYGVQVYAGNKFNAALCVLGFDGSDSRFTNDVKAYLSNESTGGSFYEFSNLFTNNNSPSFSGFDAYNISFQSAIGTSNTLYGAEFVWIAKYTDTLRQAAYARVEEVLRGDVGDGGSTGGVVVGDYIVFNGNTWWGDYSGSSMPKLYDKSGLQYIDSRWYVNTEYNGVGTGYPNNRLIPANLTVKARKGMFTKLLAQYPDTSKWICYFKFSGSNIDFGICANPTNIQYATNNYTGSQCIRSFSASNYCNTGYLSNNTNNLYIDGSTLYCEFLTRNDMNIGGSFSYSNGLAYYSSDQTTVPPTQWPEPDPVTPTDPPEVPTPTPTVPPTEPTITVPTAPTLPPLTYPTEPTYQTADLAAVLDAMAKHCVHLQECMKNVSDDYYESMTAYMLTLQNKDFEFLRSWFRVTLDTIRDCFDDLSDYLQRLFTWLADQMDYTFTGGDYDDRSIVWWLKQIYSKLGSGTTVRPTDPVVDPTGIGDWLDQLIKNFIAALLGLGQNVLSDVGDMVEDLTTKFPFSIPWDIAAMLALFAATPQVPVFEIPQYALTGNGVSQVGTYTIDLTPYDGVMDIARSIEKVVFAFWLAWKIDFFKAILNGIVGGDK